MQRISRVSTVLPMLLATLVACGDAGVTTSPSPVVAAPPSVSAAPSPSPSSSPAEREATPRARPVSIDHGPRNEKVVALTFDADMTEGMLAQLRSGEVRSWYNEAVVRELRSTRTPATFFISGLWAQEYPKAVRAFADDPRIEIASHSWDHLAWQRGCFGLPVVTSVAQKRAEIRDTARELERLTGKEPFYFRFPGGCHSSADLRLVASMGEQAVGWDVVSGDSFGTDPDAVADAVIERSKPGSIVVMHMHGGPNAPTTAPALRQIIPALRQRGFEFVTLSDLLG